MRMRYPASEAMLEITPMNTMIQVSAHGGATFTSSRISAPIRPASSATPTPSMATRITATMHAQPEEDHRGMRHLVAEALDPVEHRALRGRGCGTRHGDQLLDAG